MTRDLNGFEVKDERLVVKTIGENNWFRLTNQNNELKPGQSIALDTSVAAKMKGNLQVGIEIGDCRIGLKPANRGVEVFAKAKGKETPTQTITQLPNTNAPITLLVQRDEKQPDRINWFAKTKDTQKGGHVIAAENQNVSQWGIVVTAPKQDNKKPFWIANLKVSDAD